MKCLVCNAGGLRHSLTQFNRVLSSRLPCSRCRRAPPSASYSIERSSNQLPPSPEPTKLTKRGPCLFEESLSIRKYNSYYHDFPTPPSAVYPGPQCCLRLCRDVAWWMGMACTYYIALGLLYNKAHHRAVHHIQST